MYQLIDECLEVEGLEGSVVLYFNAEDRLFVAMDAHLRWQQYRLLRDVEALTEDQRQAVLKYRFGGLSQGCDVTVADIFVHGKYIECLACGMVGV